MGEIWKEIPEFMDYYASDSGKIRAPDGTFVNQSVVSGYRSCSIRGRSHSVHRLIASAFLDPPTSSKMQVNHKNGVKDDNRPENLEWLTARDNIRHFHSILKPLRKLFTASPPSIENPRTMTMQIKVSKSELAEFDAAAAKWHLERSSWVRMILMRAAAGEFNLLPLGSQKARMMGGGIGPLAMLAENVGMPTSNDAHRGGRPIPWQAEKNRVENG